MCFSKELVSFRLAKLREKCSQQVGIRAGRRRTPTTYHQIKGLIMVERDAVIWAVNPNTVLIRSGEKASKSGADAVPFMAPFSSESEWIPRRMEDIQTWPCKAAVAV